MNLCIYIINLDCLYFTDQSIKNASKKKKKTSTKKDELLSITTQHDELVITDILSSSSPLLPPLPNPPEAVAENNPQDVVLAVVNGSSAPEPALLRPQAEKKLQHPHFGGKQPKQHKPLKCISIVCKEEKDKLLAEELESMREKLDKALEELSKKNSLLCCKVNFCLGGQ